ncbi:DUF952 domain-containing protein [Mycobacterium sp. 4D054]|uniref:DUF952 domain-containing protein n=1 Tax=unclassified Mycobacterium TaxID=2642494 RepID=UPI0021B3FB7C|nr:DUF952 domain-containing protein [Mycobacterium sp. SMC-8]UXA10315.1 DUF952 domain-containing protein [Mycobacterium sp. SMC-8]
MNPAPRGQVLVHLCSAAEWERAKRVGVHSPESLDANGFVHLSSPAQVHLPANRLFAGRADLVLLRIDAARLVSPVRWEPGIPTDPDGMVFPHLYGPLPTESVISITEYRPGPDGRFPPLDD